jgi:DNA ligase-4
LFDPSEDDSQEAHPDDLHLMLVFFEVLELDGEEMLYRPYALRRQTLESIIRTIPGFVSSSLVTGLTHPILTLSALLTLTLAQTMLAERHEIRLVLGLEIAEQDLQRAFAQSLSAHEGQHYSPPLPRHAEGLVLKAAESKYNFSPAWIKLKRDYIPGLDDTIDLVVVGASWDKDRGRELNGTLSDLLCRVILLNADLHRLSPRSVSERLHDLLRRRSRTQAWLRQCQSSRICPRSAITG